MFLKEKFLYIPQMLIEVNSYVVRKWTKTKKYGIIIVRSKGLVD